MNHRINKERLDTWRDIKKLRERSKALQYRRMKNKNAPTVEMIKERNVLTQGKTEIRETDIRLEECSSRCAYTTTGKYVLQKPGMC